MILQGIFVKSGNHVALDIKLPNEKYLIVSPTSFNFLDKWGITKLLTHKEDFADKFKTEIKDMDAKSIASHRSHGSQTHFQKRTLSIAGDKTQRLNKEALRSIED